MSFTSSTILFPSHFLHRSFSGITVPCPEHLEQPLWICWTSPGPSCRYSIFIPDPLQSVQGFEFLGFADPILESQIALFRPLNWEFNFIPCITRYKPCM